MRLVPLPAALVLMPTTPSVGYGPYPFWMAGGGVGGCLGPGVDPENPDCKGTQLKVLTRTSRG